jgi:hypothetical protein
MYTVYSIGAGAASKLLPRAVKRKNCLKALIFLAIVKDVTIDLEIRMNSTNPLDIAYFRFSMVKDKTAKVEPPKFFFYCFLLKQRRLTC